MPETGKRAEYVKVINSTGCPKIQEALRVATQPDGSVEMDTDALKVAAEFVLTTPSEYEASPKKKP